MHATIQVCTYNRAHLLERVLDACFEQNTQGAAYEIVLVNDGSTDATGDVIARAIAQAPVPIALVEQPNSGLAKGRNAGIARARGERIIFIDDDVLPLPNFVHEHLRAGRLHPQAIVRGAAISVESFDDLPPPVWSLKDYSGNYFWTTNVSVPLATIRAIGGFNESFGEYGWEDVDVGLRLRFAGVRAFFNRRALAYHFKPRPTGASVAAMVRQARAQARTAVKLGQLHPHWRTSLATGDVAVLRAAARWARRPFTAQPEAADAGVPQNRPLSHRQLRAARREARAAYFEELDRAHSALSQR